MKYRAVVFDLDDTLIWDERISRQVLRETAERAGREKAVDVARVAWAAREAMDVLWQAHAPVERCESLGIVAFEGMWGHFQGEDDYQQHLQKWVPQFRTEVWGRALSAERVHDENLARKLGEFFCQRRRELQAPLPKAEEILHTLRQAGARLGLLTNGDSGLQREKIESSGLGIFFDAAIVSGEMGIGKPEPEIFHHLLGMLGVAPQESLMVGNSLSRDVVGGKRAGMHTCWLELEGEEEPVGLVEPDFTIHTLEELPRVVI